MTDIVALEAVETMRISLPVIVDGVRGSISCDLSLDSIDAWSCRLLKDAGIRLEVIGREHVSQGENYIVMSNRHSQYDLPVLYRALGIPLRMVETNQLSRIPFLAMLSGMRILPVAIDSPAMFSEYGANQEYTITVTIGTPVDPVTCGPEQISRLIFVVRDAIERNLSPASEAAIYQLADLSRSFPASETGAYV
jgi:1-acyl-sn-glycerol-3-phosphate acyltransferase